MGTTTQLRSVQVGGGEVRGDAHRTVDGAWDGRYPGQDTRFRLALRWGSRSMVALVSIDIS